MVPTLAAQTLAGSELGFMGDAVVGAHSSLCEEKEIASNKEPVDRAVEVKLELTLEFFLDPGSPAC